MARSEFSPKELSRREFLRLAGLTAAGSLTACLSTAPTTTEKSPPPRTPGLTQTVPEPKRTSIPVKPKIPNLSAEPTKEPTPKPLEFIEKIDCEVPGIVIEKYRATYEDITDEVFPSFKQKLEGWLEPSKLAPKTPGEICSLSPTGLSWRSDLPLQSGLTIISGDEIRNQYQEMFFYHNGRYYINIPAYYESSRQFEAIDYKETGPMGNDDLEVLDWSSGFVVGIVGVSSKGQILYHVSDMVEDYFDPNKIPRHALILADIPNKTKTVIRNEQFQFASSSLSADGDSLYLYFGRVIQEVVEAREPMHGSNVYKDILRERDFDPIVIDPNNGRLKFRFDERPDWMAGELNEDGSKIMVAGSEIYNDPVTHRSYTESTINIKTGERTPILWPSNLSYSSGHVLSPNHKFICRFEGFFYPKYDFNLGSMWDPLVYTPNGFFKIGNFNSIKVWRISNQGTIYSDRGDVFQYINGSYKAVQISEDIKEEVKIEKVGEYGLPLD